jgi:hypothetical protein
MAESKGEVVSSGAFLSLEPGHSFLLELTADPSPDEINVIAKRGFFVSLDRPQDPTTPPPTEFALDSLFGTDHADVVSKVGQEIEDRVRKLERTFQRLSRLF